MSIQCGEHLQLPAPSRAHNCDSCGAACLSLPLAACFELHEKRHRVNAPLGISKERVGHIIGVLGFRKVCARWVPRMLSDERVRISRELLERFEKGEDFLKKIITGDETWVHYYDPKNKGQSMEYRHKESPQPKKFKTQASAGKIMLTVFWNSERVVFENTQQ